MSAGSFDFLQLACGILIQQKQSQVNFFVTLLSLSTFCDDAICLQRQKIIHFFFGFARFFSLFCAKKQARDVTSVIIATEIPCVGEFVFGGVAKVKIVGIDGVLRCFGEITCLLKCGKFGFETKILRVIKL